MKDSVTSGSPARTAVAHNPASSAKPTDTSRDM